MERRVRYYFFLLFKAQTKRRVVSLKESIFLEIDDMQINSILLLLNFSGPGTSHVWKNFPFYSQFKHEEMVKTGSLLFKHKYLHFCCHPFPELGIVIVS